MAGEHAGDAGDPSEPIVIAKGPSDVALATAAKQDTIKTAIDAITTKLSADPATQTTLAAILAKLIANPATDTLQTAGNASLSSIASISDLIDLGGAQRLPGNGASQALTVPANTLIMRVDAEGGAVRISHTGDASATTIPRVPEEAIDYIPLESTDTPQFYGASASVIANINYYGART